MRIKVIAAGDVPDELRKLIDDLNGRGFGDEGEEVIEGEAREVDPDDDGMPPEAVEHALGELVGDAYRFASRGAAYAQNSAQHIQKLRTILELLADAMDGAFLDIPMHAQTKANIQTLLRDCMAQMDSHEDGTCGCGRKHDA